MKRVLFRLVMLASLALICWLSACQVPHSRVFIANPLTQPMKFSINCSENDRNRWMLYELGPRSGNLYKCSMGDKISIRINTDNGIKEVIRDLEYKKRYEFFWDLDKAQWDVREIAPRT